MIYVYVRLFDVLLRRRSYFCHILQKYKYMLVRIFPNFLILRIYILGLWKQKKIKVQHIPSSDVQAQSKDESTLIFFVERLNGGLRLLSLLLSINKKFKKN